MTTSAPAVAKVTMSDSKEISFGKKKSLFNVKHDEHAVHLHSAHADGEYRSLTVPHEDAGKWAAYGLRAYAKAQNIQSSAEFDEKIHLGVDPLAVTPRSSVGPAALPIESALVQVTGQTLEKVRTFLSSKSRKEVNALKADPRIAPVYAALQADLLAKAAAKRAAKSEAPAQDDLLSGLSVE